MIPFKSKFFLVELLYITLFDFYVCSCWSFRFMEDILNFPVSISKHSVIMQLQTTFAFLSYTQVSHYFVRTLLFNHNLKWKYTGHIHYGSF